MNLKEYLNELIEDALSAAMDFGSQDSLEAEANLGFASEKLYKAIDRLVEAKNVHFDGEDVSIK